MNSTSKAATTAFTSGSNLTVVPADPAKLTASVRNGATVYAAAPA